MGLSMDGVSSYLNSQAVNGRNAEAANKVSNSISSVNANSSDEELTEAVESFESYMLEQVIKQVKKSVKPEDENSSTSQMTEFYRDSTIQNLASTMVKEYGGNFTKDLVAQMKRNYGIANEQSVMQGVNDEAETKDVTAEQASAAASDEKVES